MEYSRYSPCMPEVQEELIAAYQKSMGIGPSKKDLKKEKYGNK